MQSPRSRRFGPFLFTVIVLVSAVFVGYSIASFSRPTPSPSIAETVPPTPPTESPVTAPPERRTAVAGVSEEFATPSAQDILPADPVSTETTAVAPQRERFIEDTFDSPGSGWLVRDTPTASAGYVDGRYRLQLKGQPELAFSSVLREENHRISIDVTVQEGAAGLIFLSAEPATFYRFIITNQGQYAVQVQQQDRGITSDIIEWTTTEALQQGPDATNRLVIERNANLVRCFINDQLIAELTIEPGPFTSQYGFTLTSQTGQGEALFDNLLGERFVTQP